MKIIHVIMCGACLAFVAVATGFPPFINSPSADDQIDCRGFVYDGPGSIEEYQIGLGTPMQTPAERPFEWRGEQQPIGYEGSLVAWDVSGNGITRDLSLIHIETPDARPGRPPSVGLPALERNNVLWNGSPMQVEILEGFCVAGTREVYGPGDVIERSSFAVGLINVFTHSFPKGEPLNFKVRVKALWGSGTGGYPTPSDYLGVLLSAWGGCAADSEAGARADINGDGFVNSVDLGLLLSAWEG